MTADKQLKAYIDRVLRLKEEGGCREEIRSAYAGLTGDEKTTVGLAVRQQFQQRQRMRVYFAAFPEAKLLKIGISRNVDRRLSQLSALKGEAAVLLFDFPGIFVSEGWQHAEFHEWRVEGEWFSLNEQTVAKVEEIRTAGQILQMEAA